MEVLHFVQVLKVRVGIKEGESPASGGDVGLSRMLYILLLEM